MLDAPRYLLGVAEVLVLGGSATLVAVRLRSRLLPRLAGPPGHLASGVLAIAVLVWAAELLGSFGLLAPLPLVLLVAAAAIVAGVLGRGGGEGAAVRRRCLGVVSVAAALTALLALLYFADGARLRLDTGMTGFDTTWYHAPFAAGFFQTASTWDLHYIAPQFLAWFYPANAELFHAIGMVAFGRDLLSPLLNVGWFAGCLFAAWCLGRPYRLAPFSLALAAVALSLPVMTDQAGEARNDIVGIFFLLAAVALAVNARAARPRSLPEGSGSAYPTAGGAGLGTGALLVVGLAAGLAAGTKLNFLLPAAVLVLGLPLLEPQGRRWRSLAVTFLAALAGGGYWYLRNLAHTGNPLPWFDGIGPLSLPVPDQPLGGREGHSVLGYLADGSVWSEWFLPGLRDGFTLLWPALVGLALAGLLLCLALPLRARRRGGLRERESGGDAVLWIAGLAGIAAVAAWLVAPTSASGPDGIPRGFESGLRYLEPALVLGLALLPLAPPLRTRFGRLSGVRLRFYSLCGAKGDRASPALAHRRLVALAIALVAVAVVAIGYPVQRHYLHDRYADPAFAAPGLNAAFAWAKSVSGARIATTSTRQYPLYGDDLSNRVQFVGEERPHGGFVAPTTCRRWRRLLAAGDYDYVVASRDRVEAGKPPYPSTARWTQDPNATAILRERPTAVFKLTGPLSLSRCP